MAGHRVVLGLESVDVGLGGDAAAHERDQEIPLEVDVQVQAVEGLGGVEQAADGLELLLRGRIARGCGHEHALRVRAGGGGASQEQQATARVLGCLGASLRCDEGAHGLVDVAQGQHEQAHVVLNRNRRQREVQVVAGSHLAVAGHVPRRGHDDAAREGIRELGDVSDREGQGLLVQAHLRVAEVTVVDKDKVRTSDARSGLDDRGRAVDIELLAEDLGERPLLGQ